ncbi:MAG: hypothetical protein ACREPB_00410 [Arenimonas sp.]
MKLAHRLIFSSLLLTALSCSAEEFTISNGDNNGLLKAITLANQSPEADTITLAKHGLYAISKPSGASLLPSIENSLVINGNGAEIRRYTKASVTILTTEKNSHVVIRNLILAEGSEGALINRGDLLLDRVKIVDTDSGNGQAIITNFGRLSLSNSELAYNQMPVQAHDAGVIINHGELSLSFSKIHSNTIRQNKNPLVFAMGALNFGNIKINDFNIDANDIDPTLSPSQLAGIINIGKARVYGRFPQNQIIQKSTSSLGIIANN